jgi:hypothetical protein
MTHIGHDIYRDIYNKIREETADRMMSNAERGKGTEGGDGLYVQRTGRRDRRDVDGSMSAVWPLSLLHFLSLSLLHSHPRFRRSQAA